MYTPCKYVAQMKTNLHIGVYVYVHKQKEYVHVITPTEHDS